MSNYNYYKEQLDRLNIKSEFPLSIKIFDGEGGHTHQMDLNTESIKELNKWFEKLLVKSTYILKNRKYEK